MANNSRSKQNKANLFSTLISRKRVCKISTKIIKLYGSWSSIFQTNLPGLSKPLEPCLNIWDFVFLNKYYEITKKISPCKPILYELLKPP